MTHPLAALIAGVKVKPLVWEEDFADHPFGWYETIDCGDCIVLTQSGVTVGSFPTADAAHDAAQVDYEARTLAALEAAPVPDLVEAGKVAERADTYEVWVDGKSCNMGRTIRSLLARIAAQEAETQKVRRFLKISRDEGREALERAEAAEAKVEAVIRIAASLFPGGYDNNSALICAAIAESKK